VGFFYGKGVISRMTTSSETSFGTQFSGTRRLHATLHLFSPEYDARRIDQHNESGDQKQAAKAAKRARSADRHQDQTYTQNNPWVHCFGPPRLMQNR